MTTAIEITRKFASLMETAAFAGNVRGKDIAARKVEWHLTNSPYWGGPAPSLDEARAAARHAWGDDIPDDVRDALGIS